VLYAAAANVIVGACRGNRELMRRGRFISVLMGRQAADWQDTATILNRFGRRRAKARRDYREFLSKGIGLGRRPELTGGGLIRSLGG
jgi:hypothetical protein